MPAIVATTTPRWRVMRTRMSVEQHCPLHRATTTVGACLASLQQRGRLRIQSPHRHRPLQTATSLSRTPTTRRSARSPTWAAQARIIRIFQLRWRAWASRIPTRWPHWRTGMGLVATTLRHLQHHSTTHRGQAFRARAEAGSDGLALDGRSGGFWAIRPTSPTPKRAANVRIHFGNLSVS
jgi:hypothetical protein